MIPTLILLSILVTLAVIFWPWRTDGYRCSQCGGVFDHRDIRRNDDDCCYLGRDICPECLLAESCDPYSDFFDWCEANGFTDVANYSAEETSPSRFQEALSAYKNAGEKAKQ